MFDQYYLPILPEDYIWDGAGDGEVCTMLILPHKYEDIFILGQPLFQGYYAIHDLTESKISLAVLKGSKK